MTLFYYAACLVLLMTLIAALLRAFLGPDPVNRLLAVQIMSTTCVALLLLLATVMNMPAAIDVAVIFTLLAAVTLVAFVRNIWQSEGTRASTLNRQKKEEE